MVSTLIGMPVPHRARKSGPFQRFLIELWVVIRGHQWSSVVISGHQWSSVPFQRFLIELSVRPGMSFAISVQRDPSVAYARKMIVSSCSVHASCRMAGSSWLHLMREVLRA